MSNMQTLLDTFGNPDPSNLQGQYIKTWKDPACNISADQRNGIQIFCRASDQGSMRKGNYVPTASA